jgi:hypothetical protein
MQLVLNSSRISEIFIEAFFHVHLNFLRFIFHFPARIYKHFYLIREVTISLV